MLIEVLLFNIELSGHLAFRFNKNNLGVFPYAKRPGIRNLLLRDVPISIDCFFVPVPGDGGASSADPTLGLVPDAQMEVPDEEMNIRQVSRLVGIWVHEVEQAGEGDEDEENMGIMMEAWDDVNGGGTAYGRSEKGKRGGD